MSSIPLMIERPEGIAAIPHVISATLRNINRYAAFCLKNEFKTAVFLVKCGFWGTYTGPKSFRSYDG